MALNSSMRNARGFTLIELVVVIAIVGILIAMAALATRAITAQQRRSVTATRMAAVDTALIQYVMLQKRLPCPANGALASGAAGAGSEAARDATGCTTNQANGVVPWLALGITEADITDGWERRMTYRIQPALAADGGAMDMSWCDPAGGSGPKAGGLCQDVGCAAATVATCTTPTSFLSGKGLIVKTANPANPAIMDPGATPPTGAAYVVISTGESGGGAMLNTGQVSSSTTTDGSEEAKNYANLALGGYYVDDSLSDAAGATHFDDILSRPTLLTVINKAALGPRAH